LAIPIALELVAIVCDVVLLDVVEVELDVALDDDEDMYVGAGPPMPTPFRFE
jgi:hypothetical protein